MGSLSIQFHALRREIADMVIAMGAETGVSVTLMTGTPFCARTWDGKPGAIDDTDVSSFCFTLYPVNTSHKSRYDFVMQHPNALVLDVGSLTEHGLKESWLSCKTDDEVCLRKWKEMAKLLKKNTFCGAVALRPATGETALMRHHRYTAGAQQLFRLGVNMLPIAGVVQIQLGIAK